MESKYKNIAEELIKNCEDENAHYDNWIVDLMCKLAEQVEKESFDNGFRVCSNQSYSKNDVFKFISEQRQADANNAFYYDINGNFVSCKDEVLETELIKF